MKRAATFACIRRVQRPAGSQIAQSSAEVLRRQKAGTVEKGRTETSFNARAQSTPGRTSGSSDGAAPGKFEKSDDVGKSLKCRPPQEGKNEGTAGRATKATGKVFFFSRTGLAASAQSLLASQ